MVVGNKNNYDHINFNNIYDEYIKSNITLNSLVEKYNIPYSTIRGRFKNIKYNLALKNDVKTTYQKTDNNIKTSSNDNDISKIFKKNIKEPKKDIKEPKKFNAINFLNNGNDTTETEPQENKKPNVNSLEGGKKLKPVNLYSILPERLKDFT